LITDKSWQLTRAMKETPMASSAPGATSGDPLLPALPRGWHLFAQTRAGGCTAALKAEPAFPRAACEKLPATR